MYFLDFYHKIISFIFDIVKLNIINYYQMRESNQVAWSLLFIFILISPSKNQCLDFKFVPDKFKHALCSSPMLSNQYDRT